MCPLRTMHPSETTDSVRGAFVRRIAEHKERLVFNMKKASGVIAILLLAVLAFGVFVGCGMFGKDTAKYRQFNAFTVGEQEVSVGKVIDTFNSLYQSYNRYASADDIFNAAMSSLYTQYMKVDAFVSGKTPATHGYAELDGVKYAKYVSADQAEYAIKYVKYLIYTNFDSAVETELKKDFTLNDAEKEDTGRDFKKFDDLKGATTYTDYLIAQLSVNEDMDKYIGKYYTDGDKVNFTADSDLSAYTDEHATQVKLDEYNSRVKQEKDVKDEDKVVITKEQLEKAQSSVVKKYTDSIERAYEIKMSKFFAQQVNDVIVNLITQLYDAEQGRSIDGSNFEEISKKLTAAYNNEVEAKKTTYNYKPETYVTDIEGLSDSSDILAVPDGYNYIFVKNILVPFSSAQKAVLSNLQTKLGTTDSEQYKKARTELAAQIVADDFDSEKDADGKYATVEGLFEVKSGKIALTAKGEEIFGTGVVSSDKFVELMKRFNTDTAQHSTYYDYVVRVNAPENYTAKWVKEFVAAADEAYAAGKGNYALCVSEYGVHIVYYTDEVKAQTLDFSTLAKCLDTTSREYLRFKTQYTTDSKELVSKALKELQKSYFTVKDDDGKVTNESKIKFASMFDTFLKDQGLNYDKSKATTYSED